MAATVRRSVPRARATAPASRSSPQLLQVRRAAAPLGPRALYPPNLGLRRQHLRCASVAAVLCILNGAVDQLVLRLPTAYRLSQTSYRDPRVGSSPCGHGRSSCASRAGGPAWQTHAGWLSPNPTILGRSRSGPPYGPSTVADGRPCQRANPTDVDSQGESSAFEFGPAR